MWAYRLQFVSFVRWITASFCLGRCTCLSRLHLVDNGWIIASGPRQVRNTFNFIVPPSRPDAARVKTSRIARNNDSEGPPLGDDEIHINTQAGLP